MEFPEPLVEGTLIRRYKRFIADVELADGRVVSAHCPNSGSMAMCAEPGWKVLLSRQDRPERKLKYTWELVHNGRCWIGINTHAANRLAEEAIRNGWIPELDGYETLETEKSYGRNSRIDIRLSKPGEICYVEVKNVTLLDADGCYCFPDAVTVRGRKHLDELIEMVRDGHRSVMLFVIQRSDGAVFRPAEHVDSAYATSLRKAAGAGVQVLAYRAHESPDSVELRTPVVVDIGAASPFFSQDPETH